MPHSEVVLGRLGQLLGLGRASQPTDTPEVAGGQRADAPTLQAPPAPTTDRSARARLEGASKLPPVLAAHAEDGLAGLIADVRAGRPGIAFADLGDWLRRLGRYKPDALHALREALVNRPPHPQLKAARGHAALKGPATAAGVAAILTGEVFGWPPRTAPPRPERLQEALELLGRLAPDELERRRPALEASGPLTSLVGTLGPAVFKLVDTFGLPVVERLDSTFGARRIASDVAWQGEALLPGLGAAHRRLGDAAFVEALERLDEACNTARLQPFAVLERLGGEGGLEVGALLHQDLHATRALRAEVGPQGVLTLAEQGRDALAARLTAAGRAVAEFGAREAPLYRGAAWPKTPARTPALATAEARVKQACGLPPDIALDAPDLSPAAMGRVVEHLRGSLQANFPKRAAELDRELEGRRFIAPRYYDALYDKGVKNPEHRYSVETFESWQRAADLARSEGTHSKGRPLAQGEFTGLMQQFHAAASAGMVDVHESHLKPEDLGRLRSREEDFVQLGNIFHDVDPDLAAILDRNPYLTREDAFATDKGTLRRRIAFAPGPEVPKMVADLDAWVRDQEAAGADPRLLAAEVHHRLVSIHPFMDGNGRTSKLMADFMMARAGAPEPLWRESDVLRQVGRWAEAADTGMHFHLDVVLRHWRAAMASGGPS